MSPVKRILGTLLIAVAAFVVTSLFLFISVFPWNPENLVLAENPEKADAIAVLEGEYETRVDRALSLVEAGYSRLLLFPGLRLERNRLRIQSWESEHPGLAEIVLGAGLSSTYEEALAVLSIAKTRGLRSVLLVTSSYHSYRAAWIFKKVLPRVKVISVPVPLGKEWFSLEKARSDPFHRRVVSEEQAKFAWYYLSYGWRAY